MFPLLPKFILKTNTLSCVNEVKLRGCIILWKQPRKVLRHKDKYQDDDYDHEDPEPKGTVLDKVRVCDNSKIVMAASSDIPEVNCKYSTVFVCK